MVQSAHVQVLSSGSSHGHLLVCTRTRVAAVLPAGGVPAMRLVEEAVAAGLEPRYVLRRSVGGGRVHHPTTGHPIPVVTRTTGGLSLGSHEVRLTSTARPLTWHGGSIDRAEASHVRLGLGRLHVDVHPRGDTRLDFATSWAVFCGPLASMDPCSWYLCQRSTGASCNGPSSTIVYPDQSDHSDVFTLSHVRQRYRSEKACYVPAEAAREVVDLERLDDELASGEVTDTLPGDLMPWLSPR